MTTNMVNPFETQAVYQKKKKILNLVLGIRLADARSKALPSGTHARVGILRHEPSRSDSQRPILEWRDGHATLLKRFHSETETKNVQTDLTNRDFSGKTEPSTFGAYGSSVAALNLPFVSQEEKGPERQNKPKNRRKLTVLENLPHQEKGPEIQNKPKRIRRVTLLANLPHHCQECTKAFGNEQDLHHHQQLFHRHKHIRHCIVCDEPMLCDQDYKHHKNLHASLIKVECIGCGKTFKSYSTFKDHKIICRYPGNPYFISERPFSCAHCQNDFSNRQALKKHEKVCKLSPDEAQLRERGAFRKNMKHSHYTSQINLSPGRRWINQERETQRDAKDHKRIVHGVVQNDPLRKAKLKGEDNYQGWSSADGRVSPKGHQKDKKGVIKISKKEHDPVCKKKSKASGKEVPHQDHILDTDIEEEGKNLETLLLEQDLYLSNDSEIEISMMGCGDSDEFSESE